MEELRAAIRSYIEKEYLEAGDERVIDDLTPLISGGIVDSFSMVSLKRFLEKRYAIQIPDAEATPSAFDTVAGIAEVVTKVKGRVESPWPQGASREPQADAPAASRPR